MTQMPFDKFQCDNCGACCETLMVEAHEYDARREPQLYAIDGGSVDRQKLRDGEHCIILWDRERKCCPFLSDAQESGARTCRIYATRPVACVMVEPGDAKCQQARITKGLLMLRDSEGNEPSSEVLEASCEDYDMDIDDINFFKD